MEIRDLGYVPLHECDSMALNLWIFPEDDSPDLEYAYIQKKGEQGPEDYVLAPQSRYSERYVCLDTHIDGDYIHSHLEEDCQAVLDKVMRIEDEDLPKALCTSIIMNSGLKDLRDRAIRYRLGKGA
jgi:hypothetical protein